MKEGPLKAPHLGVEARQPTHEPPRPAGRQRGADQAQRQADADPGRAGSGAARHEEASDQEEDEQAAERIRPDRRIGDEPEHGHGEIGQVGRVHLGEVGPAEVLGRAQKVDAVVLERRLVEHLGRVVLLVIDVRVVDRREVEPLFARLPEGGEVGVVRHPSVDVERQ